MFHTFNLCSPSEVVPHPRKHSATETSSQDVADFRRACEECRRRKIRCNRNQPCQACLYYKKPKLCRYAEARPSQSKLAAVGKQYRAVLERLFPSTVPESLLYLTREQLVDLVLQDQTQPQSGSSPVSETCPPTMEGQTPDTPGDQCLEVLQSMPEEQMEGRESELLDQSGSVSVSDDVNALSLSSRQPSGYLGISSINAVIKVILWIDPGSLSHLSSPPPHQVPVSQEESQLLKVSSLPKEGDGPEHTPLTEDAALLVSRGLELINAFFEYVHPFIPMLDEAQFRSTYLSAHRQDDRWKALLNVVFALGSALMHSHDDISHTVYFQRVTEVLTLDFLGKLHIESVQILGLLAGHYLHFVNEPNLAYTLMGTAVRMATALGLHREFADYPPQERRRGGYVSDSMDVRRRVWWSLFCMDTWGCMTLGRPTLGRSGPAITVKSPARGENAPFSSIALRENIRFCTIATQIQDSLATSPQIPYHKLSDLDNKLVTWYAQLPAILSDPLTATSDSISTLQTNMRWRFLNSRMLLHRPVLLSYAMRRIPYTSLRPEEQIAVDRCRSVARETIDAIAGTNLDNPTATWGRVWYILQATMVPLLGLFITNEPAAVTEACQREIDVATATLAQLEVRSPSARRAREVICHVRDAALRYTGGGFSDPLTLNEELIPVADKGGYLGDSGCSMLSPNTTNTYVLSGDQSMWDYITWAGTNPWSAGFLDSQSANDMMGLWAEGVDSDWLQGLVPGTNL